MQGEGDEECVASLVLESVSGSIDLERGNQNLMFPKREDVVADTYAPGMYLKHPGFFFSIFLLLFLI